MNKKFFFKAYFFLVQKTTGNNKIICRREVERDMCGFKSECVSLTSSLLIGIISWLPLVPSTSLWYHESHWMDLWFVCGIFVSCQPDSVLNTRCPQHHMVTGTSSFLSLFQRRLWLSSPVFPTLSASLTDWPLEYSVENCLTEVSYLQFSLTLKSVIYTLYTTVFPFEAKWLTSLTLEDKWTRIY